MQKQNPLLRIWGWGKDEHGSLIIAIIGAFVGVALGMLPYFAAAQVIIKMLAGEKKTGSIPAIARNRACGVRRPHTALQHGVIHIP